MTNVWYLYSHQGQETNVNSESNFKCLDLYREVSRGPSTERNSCYTCADMITVKQFTLQLDSKMKRNLLS